MKKLLPEIACVSGACSISVGVGMMHLPAGIITAGILLIAGGLLASLIKAKMNHA